jgi:DNA polymerase III sliding clamp (beta) subunit (PCNA family)
MCEFNGKLSCVATDSKRLSLCDGKFEKIGEPKDVNLLIPNQCVDLILNLTKAPMGDVHVAAPGKVISDPAGMMNLQNPSNQIKVVNEAWFRLHDSLVYTRLVEGRYPPHREIFPRKTAVTATLPRKEFVAAIKQARTGCDPETKRVTLDFSTDSCHLTAKSAISKAEARCQASSSAPIKINIDPDYLIDALMAGECADAKIEFVDSSRPMVLTDGSTKHLIMPLS